MSDKENILNMFSKLGHDIESFVSNEVIDWNLCVSYGFNNDGKLIETYMI